MVGLQSTPTGLSNCSSRSTPICPVIPPHARLQVKVLATDGAQTQIDISFGSVSLSTLSMTATYNYYLRRSILQATEYHSIPVVQQTAQAATAGQGRQLVTQAAPLEALGQQVSHTVSAIAPQLVMCLQACQCRCTAALRKAGRHALVLYDKRKRSCVVESTT